MGLSMKERHRVIAETAGRYRAASKKETLSALKASCDPLVVHHSLDVALHSLHLTNR